MAVDVHGLELGLLPDAFHVTEAMARARKLGGYVLADRAAYLALYGEAMAWHVPVFAMRRQVVVK